MNLQKNGDPTGMSFNLDDPKKWKKFMSDKGIERFFRDEGGIP